MKHQSTPSIFSGKDFINLIQVGVVSLLIFGPVTGLIIDGYGFQVNTTRPLIITAFVIIGKLLLTLVSNYRQRLGKVEQAKPHVIVQNTKLTKHQKIGLAISLIIAVALPFIIGKYWLSTVILALIYVLLGLGLNIVVGLAGLLDLGFVAFYAVGAYTYALGAQYLGLGFWTALPLAALLSACFGAVLGFPVLRMHGDYLAIVTLGFGEIIRLVLNNWTDFTGGPNGVSAPAPTIFGIEFTRRAKQGGTPLHDLLEMKYDSGFKYIFIYATLLIVVLLMIYVVYRLRKMPIGRKWEALREDEIACRSLGINHVTTKLSAFATGAMVGGVGGVFFAAYQGFVNPSSFTFIESALILAIVVLGGLGSTLGVILAALVLTMLPEFLREFSDYRVLIFGLLMVLMMILKPRGLLRVRRPFISNPLNKGAANE